MIYNQEKNIQAMTSSMNLAFEPNNALIKRDDVIKFWKFEFRNMLSMFTWGYCKKSTHYYVYTKLYKFQICAIS